MLCLLTACATKTPTRYYSLQALPVSNTSESSTSEDKVTLPAGTTLGIGPVKLPSMLNRNGIVTHKSGVAIKIASHDLWAGRLKEDFSRVIAELMATQLGIKGVVSVPWNTRFRPEFQLQMDVLHFSGQLGGPVRFKVNWVLSGDYGQRKLVSHSEDITLQSSADDYNDYVATLSALLAKFSTNSVNRISKHVFD